jgi:hypothetical protein
MEQRQPRRRLAKAIIAKAIMIAMVTTIATEVIN